MAEISQYQYDTLTAMGADMTGLTVPSIWSDPVATNPLNFLMGEPNIQKVEATITDPGAEGTTAVASDPGVSVLSDAGLQVLPEGDPEGVMIGDNINFPIGGAMAVLGGTIDLAGTIWEDYLRTPVQQGAGLLGDALLDSSSLPFSNAKSAFDFGAAIQSGIRGGEGTVFGGQQNFGQGNNSKFSNFYRSLMS